MIFNRKIKENIFFVVIIALLTTLVYYNHFDNSFQFDDAHTIEDNPNIRDIDNIPSFFKDATTFSILPQNQSYRPIVSTSLTIDYWLGDGYNLFYFHLTNYLSFLLTAFLIFFFVKKLLNNNFQQETNHYLAIFSSIIFLLHPANAETVNYIIARSDIISTLFILLAFVIYQYSSFSRKYYLYMLAILIGALAKPTAIMFAPILFVYILFFEKKMSLFDLLKTKGIKQFFKILAYIFIPLVLSAFIYLFIDFKTPDTWVPGGNSVFSYLITQPLVIAHYIFNFFIPIDLSADTDWTVLESIFSLKFLFGFIFLIALLIIAFLCSKTKEYKPISFGILWFLIALLPTSSFIPLSEVLNDHRTFFPYIGLIISVVWILKIVFYKFLNSSKTKKIVFVGLSFIVLILFSYGTFQRNEVWHDKGTLWKDVTIKSPKNGRGMMNYGLELMRTGDYANAEIYYQKALNLSPNYSYLYINYAILKEVLKQNDEAEKYFLKAIQLSPNHYNSYSFYGRFLYNQKRYNEAIYNLNKSIEFSKNNIDAYNFLMYSYEAQKDWDKTISTANKILALDKSKNYVNTVIEHAKQEKQKFNDYVLNVEKNPSAEAYLELSLQYYNNKNYKKCIAAAEKALVINPKYYFALNNICSAYNQLKEYKKAIKACKEALVLNPEYKLAKGNLDYAVDKLKSKK